MDTDNIIKMDESRETDSYAVENPLPFLRSPPTLQVLASNEIAIHMWRRRICSVSRTYGKSMDHVWVSEQKFDILNQLPVPTVIGNAIITSMSKFRERLMDWLLNHQFDIFELCYVTEEFPEYDPLYRFVDYIDFSDDKIIAWRLFNCDGLLFSGEKYRLACRYCWKDAIVQLWPLVSNDWEIAQIKYESGCEMIYYWTCQMMGTDFDPPEEALEFEDRSAEFRLMYTDQPNDWAVVDYFWNKVTADERLTILDELFEGGSVKTTITALSKMNETEFQINLVVIVSKVLFKLALNEDYYDYALRIWDYLCKIGDYKQLVNAFVDGWHNAYQVLDTVLLPTHFQKSAFVYELWIRAPAEFRRYFLAKKSVEKFFDRLISLNSSATKVHTLVTYSRDMNFMLEILKTVELPKRNEIWRRNWRKFIVRTDLSCVKKCMNLCFDNEDERSRFKECVMMNFNELMFEFTTFMAEGYIQHIMDFVIFCSSDPQRVENLQRRIIGLCLRMIELQDNVPVSLSMHYFDSILSHIFKDIDFLMFRAEYVLASENHILPYLLTRLDKGCLRIAIDLCEHLWFEYCPNEVKREFLKHCRNCLLNGHFSEFKISEWREFVTFCAGSEENVKVFKESIPIDVVFNSLLDKLMEALTHIPHFIRNKSSTREPESIKYVDDKLDIFLIMDNFLLWYLGDVKAVQKYKKGKFSLNQICSVVERLAPLEENEPLNLSLNKMYGVVALPPLQKKNEALDLFLKWIFEYDILKINDFKTKYFNKMFKKSVAKRPTSNTADCDPVKISKTSN